MVYDFGFMVYGFGFMVYGFGFMVYGFGCMVYGVWLRFETDPGHNISKTYHAWVRLWCMVNGLWCMV